MSQGPQHFRNRNRRRRRRGGRPGQNQNRPGTQPQHNFSRRQGGRQAPVFTGPMDHSYRQQQTAGNGPVAFGGSFNSKQDLEPLPDRRDDVTRIFAFVDDLFFFTKIQDTARKLNVKVEFVKSDKEILERLESNGAERPSLIIFDLNNVNVKPLSAIPKLRAKLKKPATSIVGFLSHVQGELKVKALEAGCDVVMPRSAFSQNLPQLLRRHATLDDDLME